MNRLLAIPGLALLPLLCAWPSAQAAPFDFETLPQSHDLSPPLSDLARMVPKATGREAPPVVYPVRHVTPSMRTPHPPGALESTGLPPASPLPEPGLAPLPLVNATILHNFEGIAEIGGAPSDANGAAGDTQYVQWVNTSLVVHRKSDSAILLGPAPGNTVFANFTGSAGADACRLSNNGDPIAQYDKLAKRWVLSQFAWASGNDATGPFYECIAVSTSSDATGTYNRYVYRTRDAGNAIAFNDYPKMAVWPDAYYFSYVLFANALGGYRGPQVCGYDRDAMLAGGNAVGRCKDLGTSFGPVLPSDLDSAMAPPTGSPNLVLSLDFNGNGSGDHLFLWRASFAANTFSAAVTVPVAPFTVACPTTFGGVCVAQPSPGERLDSLGDRLMYRNAYRNFGNREVLLVNHAVQQTGAAIDGPVAVRWYELRQRSGVVSVYQQGTHEPDTNSRWMGSLAMDKMGNIGLGYSITGPTVSPGIRYTGRLRSEPLGRMESEATIINGSGVQIDTFHRWGDYSSMSIDPATDCNFWYTQQYIAVTGAFTWQTRIADFSFGNCK